MDLDTLSPPGPSSSSSFSAAAAGRLCPCACPFCCRPSSPSWRRSMKRRLDPDAADHGPARVEVEDEVAVLREAVASQQETIQELCAELDEERNAACSAASEAMSMILRLQREKAEAQMEARQFKRFAEEKMDHDQQELIALEDLLFKREEAVQSLTFQIQAYRHLLLGYGIDPGAVDVAPSGGSVNDEPETPQSNESPTFEYTPLKCTLTNGVEREEDYLDEAADLEKYAFGETPHGREDLENLEQRICQLEALPDTSSMLEKGIIEEPPGSSSHFRRSSTHSCDSVMGMTSQEPMEGGEFPASMDRPLDDGGDTDGMSDRVYTIDSVHGVPMVHSSEDGMEKGKRGEIDGGADGGSPDIKNLYTRLQALEVDRESMRQAIMSMQTEKAQLLLLRHIAQQLHKEVSPERRITKKKSSITNFSIVSMLKWIMSFIVWRKKASRIKYTFGSSNNVGLLLLLDNSPRISNWSCITRTQG
ncbi:myosin-binding protein 7-like isoform X1 [Musa acuminata AAA Group]|uniref:myosin-binding protein 7-like isoform X1 n=1 Tax=Musa acuminata AAA Group TaxID=214697 RepID=UPI0031E02540